MSFSVSFLNNIENISKYQLHQEEKVARKEGFERKEGGGRGELVPFHQISFIFN